MFYFRARRVLDSTENFEFYSHDLRQPCIHTRNLVLRHETVDIGEYLSHKHADRDTFIAPSWKIILTVWGQPSKRVYGNHEDAMCRTFSWRTSTLQTAQLGANWNCPPVDKFTCIWVDRAPELTQTPSVNLISASSIVQVSALIGSGVLVWPGVENDSFLYLSMQYTAHNAVHCASCWYIDLMASNLNISHFSRKFAEASAWRRHRSKIFTIKLQQIKDCS
jgi:hypothetical protein